MTNAFRRTAERRNKRVWWPLSPTEMSAKRGPFRLIAPLYEKLTAYLAKKWTFATPGPITVCDLETGQGAGELQCYERRHQPPQARSGLSDAVPHPGGS